ncbi:MAG: 30S ribosomal protein S18, partial [Patescibacteria group bacterium]
MKKPCYFNSNNIKHIDYKDVETLKKFINPHARMTSKRRSGVASKNQRKLSTAI